MIELPLVKFTVAPCEIVPPLIFKLPVSASVPTFNFPAAISSSPLFKLNPEPVIFVVPPLWINIAFASFSIELRFNVPCDIPKAPLQVSVAPSSDTFPPVISRVLFAVRFTFALLSIVPFETVR